MSRRLRWSRVEVALQRHGGRRVGHLAEHVPDDEPVLDERERHVGALAHHGPYRVGGLGQPGQRPAAHRGERLGEPHRLDDMRGRDEPVLVAQQPGDLGHPALDGPVGRAERCPYQPGESMPAP